MHLINNKYISKMNKKSIANAVMLIGISITPISSLLENRSNIRSINKKKDIILYLSGDINFIFLSCINFGIKLHCSIFQTLKH